MDKDEERDVENEMATSNAKLSDSPEPQDLSRRETPNEEEIEDEGVKIEDNETAEQQPRPTSVDVGA